MERKRQRAELAKISREMRSPLMRNSVVWVGVSAIFLIMVLLLGYYFYCFYNVNLSRKNFEENYKTFDIQTLVRFAPDQMRRVEQLRAKAEKGNVLIETKNVIKAFRDANILLHEARDLATGEQEKYRKVRHEFTALYDEAKQRNLAKYAPAMWEKAEACNLETKREGEEAFLSEAAVAKLSQGIEILKEAQRSFESLKKLDEVMTTFVQTQQSLSKEEWARSLGDKMAAVQNAETRAQAAAKVAEWDKAAEQYQAGLAILQAGLQSVTKAKNEATQAASRFNEALTVANPKELAVNDPESWAKLDKNKKTIEEAINSFDYATATNVAREASLFLEKIQGNVDEIRATRDQKLKELEAGLKTAMESDKFLKTNAAKEWTNVQLAYEDILNLAKAGDYRGVIKKSEDLKARLDALISMRDELMKGSSATRDQFAKLMLDPRVEVVQLNFPGELQQIIIRRGSAERLEQRNNLKEAYKTYEEAYASLKKLIGELGKIEVEAKALRENCSARRHEFRRGIEGFRKPQIPKIDTLTKQADSYLESRNYSLALPRYKELASLLPVERFTADKDGTVTDNVAGVMWAKDGTAAGCNGSKALTWYEALKWVDVLQFAGFDDWQLPTEEQFQAWLSMSPKELLSQLPNTVGNIYWSKVPGSTVEEALAVDLDQHKIVLRAKAEAHHVRACRIPVE
ncbi:MAG: hypothetical protein A3K19_18880 [Lentisphaerae bacterium RIFOXYB12_FULL_65_16]|nr:MAG: hypothetical protein A3K18_12925 [Lentisphaerae bacterium RIFOXYA12_64_32]OGV86830.1 MAG: hypothetical protein A3K19_18880 [Lentisphaerae bacterium RIFOXYB12_FULL_65_16]